MYLCQYTYVSLQFKKWSRNGDFDCSRFELNSNTVYLCSVAKGVCLNGGVES